MADTGTKHFLCDTIAKALLRSEWTSLLQSFNLYCDSEDITYVVRKKNKLLNIWGAQRQEVAYNLLRAVGKAEQVSEFDCYASLVNKTL